MSEDKAAMLTLKVAWKETTGIFDELPTAFILDRDGLYLSASNKRESIQDTVFLGQFRPVDSAEKSTTTKRSTVWMNQHQEPTPRLQLTPPPELASGAGRWLGVLDPQDRLVEATLVLDDAVFGQGELDYKNDERLMASRLPKARGWRLDYSGPIPRRLYPGLRNGPAIGRDVDTGRRSAFLGPWTGGAGWRTAFSIAVGRDPSVSREVPFHTTKGFGPYRQSGRTRLADFGAYLLESGVVAQALGCAEGLAEDEVGEGTWLNEIARFAEQTGVGREPVDGFVGRLNKRTEPIEEQQRKAIDDWDVRRVISCTDPNTTWPTTDAELVDRLIQGMCPHEPHVVERQGQIHLVWTFTWTGKASPRYDQDGVWVSVDERAAQSRMPDIEVWSAPVTRDPAVAATVHEDERPRFSHPNGLSVIILRWPDGTQEVVTPDATAPGEHASTHPWDHAKRLVRQAILVAGQLDWHVSRCHFYVEQLCVVLCQALRSENRLRWNDGDHPLLDLLWPFVRSADEINRFGEETLFTKKGLLVAATSLSGTGATRRLRHQLRAVGWHQFHPPRPLTPKDGFRVAGALAWQAIGDMVDRALTRRELDFSAHWPTVGADLTRLLQRLQTKLQADELWLDDPERPSPPEWAGHGGEPPRGSGSWTVESVASPTVRPEPRAVPKLRDDCAGWKAFAQHLIWSATFLHSWIGAGQLQDGGHVLSAPLGLQDARPAPGAAPSTWGPVPEHAGFQLALTELIGCFDWGTLQHAAVEAEWDGGAVPYETLLKRLEERFEDARSRSVPTSADFEPGEMFGRILV